MDFSLYHKASLLEWSDIQPMKMGVLLEREAVLTPLEGLPWLLVQSRPRRILYPTSRHHFCRCGTQL